MKNRIEEEISKGWEYLANQELDKAEELCKELNLLYKEQEKKEKINIKKYIVRVEIAKREWNKAKENVLDIMKLDSNIAEIYKLKAMIEYHLDNYKESEEEFKIALNLAKEREDEKEINEIKNEILVCLHEYTLNKKEIDSEIKIKILKKLEEISLNKIQSIEIAKYLGKIYSNLTEYSEAEKLFIKALSLAKEDKEKKEIYILYIDGKISIGLEYLKQQKIDKAEDICKELDLLYERQELEEKIKIKEYKIRINIAKQEWDKAKENINFIVNANFQTVEICKLKAIIEFNLNNYKESIEWFKKTLVFANKKEKERTYLDILVCVKKYIEIKKYIASQEVEKINKLILEINSQNLLLPDVFELIAKINLLLKNCEQAEKYFIKTIKLLYAYKKKNKIYILYNDILGYLVEYLLTNKKIFESKNIKHFIKLCNKKRYYEKLFDLALALKRNEYYRKTLHILFILKKLKNENFIDIEIIDVLIKLKKYFISEKYIDNILDLKLKNSMLNKLEIAQQKVFLKSYPLRMTVSLITSCNLRCKMCPYNKDELFQLSRYQVDDIIKMLPYVEDIEWNGGEVFLFKYFDELLDSAYKNKVKQYITSNGLLINDVYAEKIVKYDINLILSIDSADKKVYENIRVGSSFNVLCKNIERLNYYYNLYNKKTKLCINAVLSKWNYCYDSNFIDILLFAKKNNFYEVRIYMDLYEKNKEIAKNILLKFEKQKDSLINLAEKLKIGIQFVIPSLEIATKCKDVNNNKINIDKVDNLKLNMNNDIQKNSKIFCSLPFRKILYSFKGIVRPECVCQELAYVGENSLPYLPKYKSIEDYWNGKEILEMRENVYKNKLNCFKTCYLPNEIRNFQ